MSARKLSAVLLLLPVLLLAGCTSGNGEAEDSAAGGNQTSCDALEPAGDDDGLIGFAGITADGLSGTTGGAGGTLHSVSTHAELAGLLDNGSNTAPKIIEIAGALAGSGMLEVGSNTTIIGVGDNPAISGFGLRMTGAQNIIITNLNFTGGVDNAIRIADGSHHVWLHHNAFSGYDDDAVEIREGASYVSVAWNHFHDLNKAVLTGHSDENAGQDVGRLKVTYHHNWFDGTAQRNPLVRFGEVHVFNNYYDDVVLYGIASTLEAEVLAQANYFESVPKPTSSGASVTGILGEGDLVECGNVYVDSGSPETRGMAFDPAAYYSYPLDAADEIPDLVRAGAGPGFIAPADDPPAEEEPPPLNPPPVIDPPLAPPPEEEPPPPEEPLPPPEEPLPPPEEPLPPPEEPLPPPGEPLPPPGEPPGDDDGPGGDDDGVGGDDDGPGGEPGGGGGPRGDDDGPGGGGGPGPGGNDDDDDDEGDGLVISSILPSSLRGSLC